MQKNTDFKRKLKLNIFGKSCLKT